MSASGPCAECAKFSVEGVEEKLAAAGFGACEYLRKWHLMSQKAACAFEPSRFKGRVQVSDNLPEEIDFDAP